MNSGFAFYYAMFEELVKNPVPISLKSLMNTLEIKEESKFKTYDCEGEASLITEDDKYSICLLFTRANLLCESDKIDYINDSIIIRSFSIIDKNIKANFIPHKIERDYPYIEEDKMHRLINNIKYELHICRDIDEAIGIAEMMSQMTGLEQLGYNITFYREQNLRCICEILKDGERYFYFDLDFTTGSCMLNFEGGK